MTGIVAVTGAAGALGSKTVEILAAGGWTVVGIDLGKVASDGVALALGGVDLTDEAAVGVAAARIEKELGRLDGLSISQAVSVGKPWQTAASRHGTGSMP